MWIKDVTTGMAEGEVDINPPHTGCFGFGRPKYIAEHRHLGHRDKDRGLSTLADYTGRSLSQISHVSLLSCFIGLLSITLD